MTAQLTAKFINPITHSATDFVHFIDLIHFINGMYLVFISRKLQHYTNEGFKFRLVKVTGLK